MPENIDRKLQELGIELPQAAPPAANYVPWSVSGNTLYIAGQLPWIGKDKGHIGRLGENASTDQGRAAARNCAINIIAQAKSALGGDLSRVTRCLKLGGFVNCTPDFTDHPQIINGASDLMVAVFGDAGKHARFAVGAPSLPFGVMVEIDAIFEIR